MNYFSTIFKFVSSNQEYSIEKETLNLDSLNSGPDTLTCGKRKKVLQPHTSKWGHTYRNRN